MGRLKSLPKAGVWIIQSFCCDRENRRSVIEKIHTMAEQQQSTSDLPSRLFVLLPKDELWSEDKLKSEFSSTEGLVSVTLGRDRSGKCRGFAFIQYSSHDQAQTALNSFSDAKSFQVSWATEKTKDKRVRTTTNTTPRKEVKRSLSPRDRPVEKRPKKKNESSKLFVTSGYKYSRQELDAMFRIYGDLQRITIVPVQGKLKTMAYVDYSNTSTAASVVESMSQDSHDEIEDSPNKKLAVTFASEEDSTETQDVKPPRTRKPPRSNTPRSTSSGPPRRDEDELLSTVEQRLAHLMRTPEESQMIMAAAAAYNYYPYSQYPPTVYSPYYRGTSNSSTTGYYAPPAYYSPNSNTTTFYAVPYNNNTTTPPLPDRKKSEKCAISKSSWVVVLCDEMLDESDLRDICAVYGVIDSLVLDPDQKHAYIKFDSVEATMNAIYSLNGRVLFQQVLNVFAVPAPPAHVVVCRRKRPRMQEEEERTCLDDVHIKKEVKKVESSKSSSPKIIP